MAYVNEPGVQPIANFLVPVKGTWKGVAVHNVPVDAVYDSLNVFLLEGKLQNRPGLTLLNSTVFNSPILGAQMIVTPTEKRVIATDMSHLYELGEFDTNWTTRTTTNIADSNNSIVDIALMETSSEYVAFIATQGKAIKKWTIASGLTAITPASGSTIPQAKSLCIAGRRVIALVPPHTVKWSKVYDYTTWLASAENKVAQTGDVGICLRTLGSLSFVLYKERSIYMVRAQGGDDATAFSFSEPIDVEGPAGIRAVVKANASHVYMTRNGRIAMFNGSQYPQWIADGIWKYLQRDIEPSGSPLITGIYDYRLNTVVFYYPRKGDPYRLTGMVIVNLPFSGMEADQGLTPAAFLGTTAIPISHACELRFNQSIDRSLIFSSTPSDFQSFTLDEQGNTDDGVSFPCMFQTGLQSLPNALHGLPTLEFFLERGMSYGGVTVEPVLSNGLENKSGTIYDSSGQYIDLEVDPLRQYKGFNIPTRFFGLRYTWDSTNRVRYAGTLVHGRILS